MAGRYYFHLVDSENVIRDDLGAVAMDLAAAHKAASEIIREFRVENASCYWEWSEWKLVVTDDTDAFALVLPLDS